MKEHAWKVCIRQRIGGSNPPLTATFKEESRLTSGLFFAYSAPRGMRSPDRGSASRYLHA
ncbi:Uncharacterized protein BN1183_BA_00730 [Pantoea ananatis]|nr:Uncharacterized protein BN1183_BA_00730 [Pantoea ananatis]